MKSPDKIVLWLLSAVCTAASVWMLLAFAWQGLVDYRIHDGLAFEADVRAGVSRYELVGHRCAGRAADAILDATSLQEPCPPAGICRRFPMVDDVAWHVSEAFCYTVFPVDCASWSDGGKIQYDTCDKIFPHGWQHVKNLVTP